MQEAERSMGSERVGDGAPPPPASPPRVVSPLIAFVVLVALIAVVVLVVQLTADDTGTTAPADSSDAPSESQGAPDTTALTDDEAIVVFEDLALRGLEAQRTRDLSALDSIYTQGGPASEKARQDIDALIEQGVRFEGEVQRLSVQVTSITSDEFQIQETRLVYPCFVDEDGRDVTRDPHVLRQVADLRLQKIGTNWLIHGHVVRKAEQLDRANEDCP